MRQDAKQEKAAVLWRSLSQETVPLFAKPKVRSLCARKNVPLCQYLADRDLRLISRSVWVRWTVQKECHRRWKRRQQLIFCLVERQFVPNEQSDAMEVEDEARCVGEFVCTPE